MNKLFKISYWVNSISKAENIRVCMLRDEEEGKMRQIPLLSHKFPTCLFIFPFRCMYEIRLHKILLYQATEVGKEEAKKSFIKKLCSLQISFDSHSILWLFTHSAVFSSLRRRDCFHKYWCLLFCYFLLHSLRFIFYFIFFQRLKKISLFFSMSKIS